MTLDSAATRRPASRSRLPKIQSRRVRRALIVVVVVLIIFCAITARLFIFPVTGMPTRVDAIVVPGGPGNRIALGLKLAEEDRAEYLILSEGQYVPPNLCGTHVGGASVLCFQPNPATTQGEAEGTARLARKYGFQSIVLITTPDQTWRAELRFRRCYSGHVYGVTTPLPLSMWPDQIAYQWAATVKAEVVNRGC